MAHEVNAHGAVLKVRNPAAVFGLSLITLGIYAVVWYYKINREMRDLGRAYNDGRLATSRPARSVWAITLGALIIVPAMVSYYRTIGRVRRVQRIGQTELTSGWMVLVLYLLGIIIPLVTFAIPAYIQSGLNELWNRFPLSDPGMPQASGLATDAALEAAPPPAPPPSPPPAPTDVAADPS